MIKSKVSETGLGIDKIDKKILTMLQHDPNITHMVIAKEVGLSQPSIGNRIRKLESIGILDYQAGINLRNSSLLLARVDLHAKDPNKILELVHNCQLMSIGFKLSGFYNLSILVAGPDLKFLEKLVNTHFRNNDLIDKVNLEIISGLSDNFILPIGLDFDQCDCGLKSDCSNLKEA